MHKIVMLEGEENRQRIKKEMAKFVEDRWLSNKSTILQDIQNIFQVAPYNLSEGSVRKYLDEVVAARKISTWKNGKNRYYGPPKIPASIKFGLAIEVIIILLAAVINGFSLMDFGLPSIIYSSFLVIVFTTFSYIQERKLYK